jgi:site-specific DNA recombinase
LLHDEAGDRLVPSHAVKGGKRYRYYISSRLITGSRADAPDGIRVPAAEIESGVIERVRQFLTNGAAVFEALQHLELDVGHAQQLMRRTQEIADTLPNSRRSDLATVLRTLISHIEVQSDQISIALQLGGLLTQRRGLTAVAAPVANDTATETAAPLVVTVPLLRRRAGRDTRLLMDGPDAMRADPALVRVLARTRARPGCCRAARPA